MASRSVSRIIAGMATSDGAGVRLTRLIGGPALPELDPFLLLDAFGSDDPNAYIAGFPEHPHRGFETVTYMLAGHMRHRDNHGNEGDLGPGSVQWMTAGRGIVHSEMPLQEAGLMQGFQLWVNLPARLKMTAPRYQDIPAARIPEIERPGARIRVIAGVLLPEGLHGPVDGIVTEPLYLDVALAAGARIELPVAEGHNALCHVFAGEAQVAGRKVAAGQLAVLGPGTGVELAAEAPARLLLIAGRPIGEPVARYGPFVMNSEAELRQAFHDYQAGRL